MNNQNVDLTLAKTVNIAGLNSREEATINFDSTELFEGVYQLIISDIKKTTTRIVSDSLTVAPNKLIWNIKPEAQGISGKNYYEIFDESIKRVIYKGIVSIEKSVEPPLQFTREITELNAKLDNAFIGLNYVVNGYTRHYLEEMSGAAFGLLDNINSYGGENIINESISEKTTKMAAIINDWTTIAERIDDIDMLGLFDWQLKLKSINDELIEAL